MLNKDELKIELEVEDIKAENEKDTTRGRGVTSTGCCQNHTISTL